ncbi:hypothetical protein AAMO2058_001167900 [Amorphochlora amoebiformis]
MEGVCEGLVPVKWEEVEEAIQRHIKDCNKSTNKSKPFILYARWLGLEGLPQPLSSLALGTCTSNSPAQLLLVYLPPPDVFFTQDLRETSRHLHEDSKAKSTTINTTATTTAIPSTSKGICGVPLTFAGGRVSIMERNAMDFFRQLYHGQPWATNGLNRQDGVVYEDKYWKTLAKSLPTLPTTGLYIYKTHGFCAGMYNMLRRSGRTSMYARKRAAARAILLKSQLDSICRLEEGSESKSGWIPIPRFSPRALELVSNILKEPIPTECRSAEPTLERKEGDEKKLSVRKRTARKRAQTSGNAPKYGKWLGRAVELLKFTTSKECNTLVKALRSCPESKGEKKGGKPVLVQTEIHKCQALASAGKNQMGIWKEALDRNMKHLVDMLFPFNSNLPEPPQESQRIPGQFERSSEIKATENLRKPLGGRATREEIEKILVRIGCPVAAQDVIFLARSGSYMYNLHTPESDRDYYIVYSHNKSKDYYKAFQSPPGEYRKHETRLETSDKRDVDE